MLSCSACVRRAVQSLTRDRNVSCTPLGTVSVSRIPRPETAFSRGHATLQSIQKGHHRRDLYKALRNKKAIHPLKLSRVGSVPAKAHRKDVLVREDNRARLTTESTGTNLDRAMRLEAKFLVDPMKLAQSIVEKLRDSDFDAAMSLVRASEKARDGMPVENTVSWNHIIDWLMSQGEPSMAWKVYNEMKKRGHKPDAHTYTIMLRGYRDNVKKPNVVKQAVAVYHSISAANSVVTPTIIHTNAVLGVCARANDIESLWSIAGRLPDKGPGAPDHITFTTILQAINAEVRARAVELGARNGPNYDVQPIFEQAVSDARKLWSDITARWRKGDLRLDEELVCAMGRLLMLSTDPKAHEDVLKLVQQTMNIPRTPGDLGRRAEDLTHENDNDTVTNPGAEAPFHPDVSSKLLIQQGPRPTQVKSVAASVYAIPGQNTLSMLLETATALRYLQVGRYYWDLLTAPEGSYKIVPDHGNVMVYLRFLRVCRASQATLDVLRMPRPKEIQDRLMNRGTFLIAMSTCLRDKRNPNVFEIASRILDLMQGSAEAADQEPSSPSVGQQLRLSPKVLTKYLEVALATTHGLNGSRLHKTKDGDLDFERDPRKNNTLRALRRLGPDMVNVKRLLKVHLTELEQQAAVKARTPTVQKLLAKRELTHLSVSENISELVDFLRMLIGAYDKIIMVNERLEDDGMGPLDKDLLTDSWSQKRKLSAFLGKVMNTRGVPKEARRDIEQDSVHRYPPTEASEENFGDEAGEGLDMTLPNQRTKTLRDINRTLAKKERAKEESGLSRRQKRELEKEERIRKQFPASMLKPTPSNQSRTSSRKSESHDRHRTTSTSQQYSGWGGGFEALAREQGQGEKTSFVELRP